MRRAADTVWGMILERFPELLKLSDDERVQLSDELAETVFVDVGFADPDPALVAELDRRWQDYLRDPSTARPAAEVLAELRGKYLSKPGV